MAQPPEAYLRYCPWDVDRWFASDTHLRNDLDVQGAYLNLCLAAFRRQPTTLLPDDDDLLWRLSGARSKDHWLTLRARVFGPETPWVRTENGWIHVVVKETYDDALASFMLTSRAGRIGGKASGRVRREAAKQRQMQLLRTTVEPPLNDRGSIEVNRTEPNGTEEQAPAVSPSLLEPETSRPVNGAAKPTPDSWSGRFCSDWKEIVSGEGGEVPGGKIGHCLRNLVHRLSEDRVRPVWQHYLRTEPRPAPRFFAENYAKWEAAAKTGRGIFDRPTLTDRNAAVGAAWERETREGRR